MRSPFNDAYAILFSDFLYKNICCGYSFELPQGSKAIQMSTHNICFNKELSWSLMTRQPLWVILCRLPEKGKKERRYSRGDEREGQGRRGTGMKVKKQEK